MKRLLSAIRHHREIKTIQNSALFDERYYLTHCPDAARSSLSPIEHYLRLGSQAGLKPNPFFDDLYYRDANPDLRKSQTNPLVHYIRFGAKEGRNPSRSFDTRYYLRQHPDVAQAGVNPLWHFLTYGQSEHRETNNARGEALSLESRTLYDELAQLEPLLPVFDDLEFVALDRGANECLAGRAYFRLAQLVKAPFTHLFVLSRLIHGGADRLAMHYVNLVKEKRGPQSVLVLLADLADRPARHLLPAGVEMIALDDVQPGLSQAEKIQVVARFIIEAQPAVVHNVNSVVCWEVFSRYHRQLRLHTRLVASLFTCHYNQAGRRVGLVPQYLNSCIDHIDLILTDNAAFKTDSASFYGLEAGNQDKIVVAPTPVLDELQEPDEAAGCSKRILWASRLHYDKRPEVLAEIARRLPDFRFEVHGVSYLAPSELDSLKQLKNVTLNGGYSNFEDLPADGVNAYLYTTRHDGLPLALMEAIAAGLPIIAPDVGGTRELITNETGWLIAAADDVEAYVEALMACHSNPQERLRRARNAQSLLKQHHSWATFARTVAGLCAYHLS